MAKRLDLKDVNIYYGSFHAVAEVSMAPFTWVRTRTRCRDQLSGPRSRCSRPTK